MSILLDLPREMEDELSDEAARLGMPLSEYVKRILSAREPRDFAPETGAELVKLWQREGLVGSRPELPDDPGHARELRRQAERRVRE
jgi:hypothetical protein